MKTMMAALWAVLLAVPAAARQDSGRAEAARKLESMKISVDFENVTLSQAVDYFREVTDLNFVIRSSVPDQDAKIRLKVKDVAVRSALKLLLAGKELAATWKDGVVVIGPREEVGEPYTLRMYDVRDTVLKIQDFEGPVMELVKPGGSSLSGITVSFVEPREVITPDFIVELVKDNTGGRSWEDSKAALSHVNGMLVVNQTPAVHREIARLLSKLGQFR